MSQCRRTHCCLIFIDNFSAYLMRLDILPRFIIFCELSIHVLWGLYICFPQQFVKTFDYLGDTNTSLYLLE